MKRQWWLGALALVAMGCGGDGGDNDGGGGNAIASETVAALTDDARLVVFDTNAPGTILREYAITGLPAGDPAVSLDYRPDSGNLLYLVTEGGQLFTVSELGEDNTLAVTLVSNIGTSGADVREIDFNPVADRLRMALDGNGSLRVNPTDGATVVDTAFAYGDGARAEIQGVGYTNSFGTATTTTLYGIDVAQDALVRIDPPNAGTLTRVGPLGIDLSGRVPFDISPADETLGFLAQGAGSRSRIVSVDVSSGSTVRGRLTPAGVKIVGMTVLPQS